MAGYVYFLGMSINQGVLANQLYQFCQIYQALPCVKLWMVAIAFELWYYFAHLCFDTSE